MRRRAYPLIGLLCAASAAHATRAVPMLPQMRPAPPQELREKFHDAVVRGMGGEVEIVPASEVRMRLFSSPDLLDCTGGTCIGKVASTLHAERVVVADIDQIGKNYAIKVTVFDAAGAEVGKATETCEICSVREAQAAVTRATSKAAPLLVVKSAPPPVPEARTGTGAAAPEGPEAPRATPPVIEPQKQEPAPKKEVEVKQEPPAKTGTAPTATTASDQGADGFPYRPVAFGTFGVAAATLITTIGFAAFAGKDGMPSNCNVSIPVVKNDPRCPTIYQGNGASAAVFGVVTGLLAATGALILFLDWRHRRHAPVVTVAPTADGVAVGAFGQF